MATSTIPATYWLGIQNAPRRGSSEGSNLHHERVSHSQDPSALGIRLSDATSRAWFQAFTGLCGLRAEVAGALAVAFGKHRMPLPNAEAECYMTYPLLEEILNGPGSKAKKKRKHDAASGLKADAQVSIADLRKCILGFRRLRDASALASVMELVTVGDRSLSQSSSEPSQGTATSLPTLFQTVPLTIPVYVLPANVVRRFQFYSPDMYFLWIDLLGSDMPDPTATSNDPHQGGKSKPGAAKVVNPFRAKAGQNAGQRTPPVSGRNSPIIPTGLGPTAARRSSWDIDEEEDPVTVEEPQFAWPRAVLTVLESLDDIDFDSEGSYLCRGKVGSRLLLPLLDRRMAYPEFRQDSVQPSAAAFVLRVADVTALGMEHLTIRSLTNRWTIFVDLAHRRIATIHRTDSHALATLRAEFEEFRWAKPTYRDPFATEEDKDEEGKPKLHYDVRLLVIKVVERFMKEYEKAFRLTEALLDQCEAKLLRVNYRGNPSSQPNRPLPAGQEAAAAVAAPSDSFNPKPSPTLNKSLNGIGKSGRSTFSFFAEGGTETVVDLGDAATLLDNVNDLGTLHLWVFALQRRISIFERMIELSRIVVLDELCPFLGLPLPNALVEEQLVRPFAELKEYASGLRRRSSSLISLHLGTVAGNTNYFSLVLAVTGFLFMPVAATATVMGMNFPWVGWHYPHGYWLTWLGMLLITFMMTVGLGIGFRRSLRLLTGEERK